MTSQRVTNWDQLATKVTFTFSSYFEEVRNDINFLKQENVQLQKRINELENLEQKIIQKNPNSFSETMQ